MLQQAAQFVSNHPYLTATVGTWLFNNVVTVLVSSLPAPTKTSSASYVYWFKVLNTIIGNVKRAQSTALENSPNWHDAVNAHLAMLAATSTNSPLQVPSESLPKAGGKP
jgi:hypothetical protein